MANCTVCFESATGVRLNDYFVSTRNGHVFHFCCLMEFVEAGTSLCPICDEDLRSPLVRLNSHGPPAPARPPKPGASNGMRSPTPTPTGSSSALNDPWRLDGPRRPTYVAQSQLPAQPSASFSVQPDYVFKIVVLGNFNVGKSSLLQRYADDRFDPTIPHTVGCDLRVKVLSIAGKIVRLHLWDTAGQERHRAVVDMYLRRADGILFCFDITDGESFVALQDWFQFSQRCLPSDTLKIIVGTKSDLWAQRVVHTRQIQNLAESWNAQYIYTSAKDAMNVEIVFRSLAALILESRLPSTYNNASTSPSAPPQEPQNPFFDKKEKGPFKLYNPFTYNKKQSKKKSEEFEKCCI